MLVNYEKGEMEKHIYSYVRISENYNVQHLVCLFAQIIACIEISNFYMIVVRGNRDELNMFSISSVIIIPLLLGSCLTLSV